MALCTVNLAASLRVRPQVSLSPVRKSARPNMLCKPVRAVQAADAGVSKKGGQSMFNKLGGKQAIEGVVDEFYSRVFVDDEVKGFFEGINKQRLKAHQVQFMTYAFGGPEEYHGKDMFRAHERLVREKGMNDHHFDVIVKHLVAALKAFNVPEEDIAAAGQVVETTRDPMFRDPKTQEYLG
ncbi:hypothetical protein ABBQ32_002830 [Trebouxia sp. C0010 RCD-2024]